MVKRPTIPINNNLIKVPFLGFAHNLNTQLLWQPERTCNAKGAESKSARKKEWKEARKKFRMGSQRKIKKSQFLCA